MGAMHSKGQHRGATLRRRGLATVWLILSLPVLLVALCLTVDLGKIWVERAALVSAVDAAALAAVRQWVKDLCKLECEADIVYAIQEGIAYGLANQVDGKPLDLTDSSSCNAHFEFGCIIDGQFCPNEAPNCGLHQPPAVRVTVTNFTINSACGMSIPYTVSAQAIAYAPCGGGAIQTKLYTPKATP